MGTKEICPICNGKEKTSYVHHIGGIVPVVQLRKCMFCNDTGEVKKYTKEERLLINKQREYNYYINTRNNK